MTGSLTKAKGFVSTDVFSLSSLISFTPEQIDLGQYTFLPWVRTGLAAQLVDAQAPSLRATVTATIAVEDDTGGSTPVSQTLTLRGPSDVLGIDPTQVVRRYPEPNSFNAEETYLAHIEFDRPELPWLFSPFKPAGDRLAPWIVLIVVEERFSNVSQGPPGLPLRITTKKGELQPLSDSWAWAHAQISGAVAGGVSVEDRLTDSYGPTNLSRLLNPRKLDPETSYVACVVPAFDCGVQAGLGLAGGTLNPAWTRAAGDNNQDITLPVYDYWRFRIAPAGDFESLAEKLKGFPAPWPIGRRVIDFSLPRGGMNPLATGEDGRVQILKCALTSLAAPPANLAASAWTNARRQELLAVINAGDQLGGDISKAADLPRVSPRLYARFQRAESRALALNDADWFPQLNSTPTHRVVAGLGTRVIQKDQEALMQAAWAQVGEIDKANRRLALAQFARYAAESLHKNHLSRLQLGALSQVTRGVHGKLRAGGDALTIFGTASRSSTAPAALTGAFRRATRLRGPLTRFYGTTGAKAVQSLVAVGIKFQDFRRAYQEPDGINGLSASAVSFYPAATIAKVLNVQPAVAVASLQAAIAKSAAKPSVADQLLAPQSTWHIPAGTVNLGAVGASRLLDLVEAATPVKLADSPSRVEALAAILSGVSKSGITETAGRAGTLAGKLGVKLTATTTTPVATRPLTPVRFTAVPVAHPPVAVSGPLAGISTHIAPVAPLAAGIVAESSASLLISVKVNPTGAISYQQAAASFSQLTSGIGAAQLPKTPDLPPFTLASTTLLTLLHPKTTVTAHLVARLGKLPSWLPKDWFDDGFVQPIMQAPIFTRPMYEALDSYDRQWLIPGLGTIQETDFVTILETNPAFVEAFLVGLSDEMGRELLWRGFPTDSRGTYFKRFWLAQQDELAQPIHQFSHTPLGSHISAAAGGATGRLVLLVRGELIRRYPNAIMLAQQQIGKEASGHPTFAAPPAPGAPGSVLFHVPLPPDIFLTGFLLTEAEVRQADAAGHPWWFIIAEHPTAPRFGLDLPLGSRQPLPHPPLPPHTVSRDAATWADFSPLRLDHFLDTAARVVTVKEPTGGESTEWSAAKLHGGAVARALLQDPFRAAWNGLKLIGPAKP
jgi:hypothetical protein